MKSTIGNSEGKKEDKSQLVINGKIRRKVKYKMGRFLIESEQLKKEYAKFIESFAPYIWYCHFTFRYNISR